MEYVWRHFLVQGVPIHSCMPIFVTNNQLDFDCEATNATCILFRRRLHQILSLQEQPLFRSSCALTLIPPFSLTHSPLDTEFSIVLELDKAPYLYTPSSMLIKKEQENIG